MKALSVCKDLIHFDSFNSTEEKIVSLVRFFCFQSFQCKLSSGWIISFLNPDRKIYVLAPIHNGYASLLACWKPTKLFSLNKFALQKFAWLNIGLALLGLHRVEFEKKKSVDATIFHNSLYPPPQKMGLIPLWRSKWTFSLYRLALSWDIQL